jgi:hypothetical protein
MPGPGLVRSQLVFVGPAKLSGSTQTSYWRQEEHASGPHRIALAAQVPLQVMCNWVIDSLSSKQNDQSSKVLALLLFFESVFPEQLKGTEGV